MSALDLRSGYFQMAVSPSDIVKTAFVTKNGTYAFCRMPFGLSGAAPNFQKAIDIILKPVMGKFVNVYMDNVIISSPSFTQHVKHLKEVFQLLHEAGLTLNKDKCKFGCEELKYLALIINKEGIKTDETKVQAIVEMKPLHNSKEVLKFLGMSQWYAKFIKNYADICEPLYNLKRKLQRFIWSIEAQKAFDAVKAAITKAPVLKFPDFKKPFELFTDPSSIGVGAVLNQEQRPVVFASCTLSAAERNYTVTERQCLAVVWALNKFRTYLGSLPIKVITDHAALTHLTTGKNLSNRMIRWALKLAEFNLEWEHRPGTQNTIADVLSRNLFESIIGEKVNCAIIRDLVLSSRDQLIEEQSLFYAKYATSLGEMRVYIPKSLRNDIMREFHDKPLADQVQIYRDRKCDETEIGTGSSDNGSLCNESSGFDRVKRRSNDSRDGKKKGSEVKRELEEKGLSFRNNQGEKHTNKTNKHGPLIRSIPSSWSEKDRMIKKSKNQKLGYKRANESRSGGPERKVQKGSEHRVPKRALSSNYRTNHSLKFRKKSRREETVMPPTSGYNLRPRNGKGVESQLTIERKAQQGGPVRSRKGKERNDSPYIEERTRSSNKNARRGGDQQRHDQERRGTCTKKSLSLEVLVGNANYKS
ncbi:retrovirus-related Pol polyprotein from transposon opus [Trichonephila clavipes]|nr:retrovirus-related Pol polyprotein from transposon opus [Trichonephila clavipes]